MTSTDNNEKEITKETWIIICVSIGVGILLLILLGYTYYKYKTTANIYIPSPEHSTLAQIQLNNMKQLADHLSDYHLPNNITL